MASSRSEFNEQSRSVVTRGQESTSGDEPSAQGDLFEPSGPSPSGVVTAEPVEEPQKKRPPRSPGRQRLTAADLAGRQRDISVSEFFAKNRHLLGFDNPTKALLTGIREAVDNSLDACEEAGILPDLVVRVDRLSEDRYCLSVEDNGPGILKSQIPKVFGKLLYGSRFHSRKQSRGQQGIGISAAALYGQLTTGKPIAVTSRTGANRKAHHYQIHIDTKNNRPEVIADEEVEWEGRAHGTEVTITLEARYVKGRRSVDDYLRATSIANPHLSLRYFAPDRPAEESSVFYPRSSESLPVEPKEILPHPHGVELGVLIDMIRGSRQKQLGEFLSKSFSRVSPRVADEICTNAGFTSRTWLSRMGRSEVETLHQAIAKAKLKAPPTNCLSPIGDELMLRSIEHTIAAEFHVAVTRSPSVYRGNPFLIEVALAYGSRRDRMAEDAELEEANGEAPVPQSGKRAKGRALASGDDASEQSMTLLRFANRVPLQYQPSACAITRAVIDTPWRNYGLKQSRGAMPSGPVTLLVNIASVWVPYTSESKEAVAHYPEIIREFRLAVQECGRRLGRHLARRRRDAAEAQKRSYIVKYLPHIGIALQEILALSDVQRDEVVVELDGILERSRKH